MLAGMDDNGVITVRDLRRRYGGTGGRGFDIPGQRLCWTP